MRGNLNTISVATDQQLNGSVYKVSYSPQPMSINVCRWVVTLEPVGIGLTDLCQNIYPLLLFHTVVSLEPSNTSEIQTYTLTQTGKTVSHYLYLFTFQTKFTSTE